MNCAKCGNATSVINSRNIDGYIWRRRECKSCGSRWSTREHYVEDLPSLDQQPNSAKPTPGVGPRVKGRPGRPISVRGPSVVVPEDKEASKPPSAAELARIEKRRRINDLLNAKNEQPEEEDWFNG